MNERNLDDLRNLLTEATHAMALAQMHGMWRDSARALTYSDQARTALRELAGLAVAMADGVEVSRDAA